MLSSADGVASAKLSREWLTTFGFAAPICFFVIHTSKDDVHLGPSPSHQVQNVTRLPEHSTLYPTKMAPPSNFIIGKTNQRNAIRRATKSAVVETPFHGRIQSPASKL